MKRFCFLAVLMALSSSAYASRSISFSVGSHRVHIESSRHCRSLSCTSVSISRRFDWRRKRDGYDDARDAAVPASPSAVPACPQTRFATRPRRSTTPAPRQAHRHRAAGLRSSVHPAASRSLHHRCRLRSPPPSSVQHAPLPRAAGAIGRESRSSSRRHRHGRTLSCIQPRKSVGRWMPDRRLADRRQGNGADRQMRRCAVRLSAQRVLRTTRARRS